MGCGSPIGRIDMILGGEGIVCARDCSACIYKKYNILVDHHGNLDHLIAKRVVNLIVNV